MDSLPDPSAFALAAAAGSAHLLGFLDRPAAARSPALAALLALPVLAAYLAAVTLAFAVRVAADVYAHVAVACGPGGDDALARAAAAILAWLANAVAKLVVALFILSGLAAALFCFSPVMMRSPGVAAL